MSGQCIQIEDLARVAELPPDDPARLHLTDCPRCRARLAAFGDFISSESNMDQVDGVEGIAAGDVNKAIDPRDIQDANTRLTAVMNREIFGEELSVPIPDSDPNSGPELDYVRDTRQTIPLQTDNYSTEDQSAFRRFLIRLNRPALRPAWGFAAVVLLFVALRGTIFENQHQPANRLLREAGQKQTAEVTASISSEPDGDLLFSWTALPGSDSCEVVFYLNDLSECGRFDGGQGTQMVISGDTIAGESMEEAAFWRIDFLCGGDLIGQTSLTVFSAED